MAGHSKFKNIMHRKGAQDKKRAKAFTKLLRDIITAARAGGGDANANPSLRTALDKARAANMTKDVMERAIKRGTGEIKSADYEERTYEGYAPGGVAVIVKTLTDNGTRTVANVRAAFNKFGGNMGSDGSVAWMFKSVGLITYPCAIGMEDKFMEAAIEAGADDAVVDGDVCNITTAPNDFLAVRETLIKQLGEPESAEVTWLPTQQQPISDRETAEQIIKMVDVLNADDDVQDVITNLQLSDDLSQIFAENDA